MDFDIYPNQLMKILYSENYNLFIFIGFKIIYKIKRLLCISTDNIRDLRGYFPFFEVLFSEYQPVTKAAFIPKHTVGYRQRRELQNGLSLRNCFVNPAAIQHI